MNNGREKVIVSALEKLSSVYDNFRLELEDMYRNIGASEASCIAQIISGSENDSNLDLQVFGLFNDFLSKHEDTERWSRYWEDQDKAAIESYKDYLNRTIATDNLSVVVEDSLGTAHDDSRVPMIIVKATTFSSKEDIAESALDLETVARSFGIPSFYVKLNSVRQITFLVEYEEETDAVHSEGESVRQKLESLLARPVN